MVSENVSLRPFNTFGIDVSAKALASFSTVGELDGLVRQNAGKLPLLILGGGSNVLLTADQEALVLVNRIKGIHVLSEDSEHVFVRVGAGEVWHEFVRYAVENGWGGIENLSLIPGSVGASPMQNIGAYGVEIKDVFVSLEGYELSSGNVHTFSREECRFGYRESVFKHELKGKYVITSVTYRLSRHPKFNTAYGAIQSELDSMGVQNLSVDAISQAVMRIRNSKLPNPVELGNAGSFFKNPVVSVATWQKMSESHPDAPHYPQPGGTVKLAAGWLIEKAGWKGFREGDAGVHEKQALVIVNFGSASGNQLFELSTRIIDDIRDKFGVTLEREVNIL